MKVKVKTIWEELNRVGIADHKVQDAILNKEPIVVIHDGQLMEITNSEIQDKIVGKSELFEDKWGRDPYRLLYFEWKPTSGKQGKIL